MVSRSGYNQLRRAPEVYNVETRALDNVFDAGLFNMTTPAPVSNLGPDEVSHSGKCELDHQRSFVLANDATEGKRPTSPEQLETSIPLKKNRHKSPTPERTPDRGSVSLFPETPSFMVFSSSPTPNDFNSEGTLMDFDMQVAPVATMYVNEALPSVGRAPKEVISGNPVEEEDTTNLLDFLNDCVQFEDI